MSFSIKFHPLIWGWVTESTGLGEKPRQPSSQRHSLVLLGDPEAFPGQKGHIIPLASPRPALGPPPSRPCPENFQREVFPPGGINQMPEPPQLTPFNAEEQQLYSDFPLDGQAPHPISKAEPSHPSLVKQDTRILKLLCLRQGLWW